MASRDKRTAKSAQEAFSGRTLTKTLRAVNRAPLDGSKTRRKVGNAGNASLENLQTSRWPNHLVACVQKVFKVTKTAKTRFGVCASSARPGSTQ